MSDEAIPDLATVMQQIVQVLQDHEQRLTAVCQSHEDLDKEIHEDFFGPIHDQYTQGIRSKGIGDLKQKYGSMFSDLEGPLSSLPGFGDLFEKLYDHLEELKKGADWNPENEGTVLSGIRDKGMELLNNLRGIKPEPAAEEAPKEEAPKPVAAMAVKVEKAPGSLKDKLAAGRRKSMLDSL